VLLDVLIALAACAWLAFMVRPALVAARMFQIEEYERIRFLRWGIGARWTAHRAVVLSACVAAVALLVAALTGTQQRTVAAGWLIASVAGAAVWTWLPPKKPLVFTARLRRVLIASGIVGAVIAALAAWLLASGAWLAAGILIVVPLSFTSRLSQVVLVAGDVLASPVEASVRRGYLSAAARRMEEVHPLVIAVAGSYGKTSTKHILAHLLAPSAKVLPTRKSFNTLMGVTRVVNEDLRDDHQIFIVEMDAYAPGEIASMCALVHPRLAVVTSVGSQHLERFHSMSRIEDALYESISALPPTGAAVVYAGDEPTASLAERARRNGVSVVTYGIGDDGLDIRIGDVHSDSHGATFSWRWPDHDLSLQVTIPLLGLHQVLNVSAALTVVTLLRQPLDAAVAACATLQPVEHRLQILPGAGGVTVIDDSYNANPVGVHNGLDVLQSFDGGLKILVTPGLVELGDVEAAENRRYGEHAAAVCDHVIVMEAKPAPALREGLRAGGMSDDRIHTAASLEDATALIGALGRPGAVVLFANDLPDTYLADR
jgi:UDP-N-acetylmuramoyl-tripeptide--D-alanyl-D-alanine ligase